MTMKSAAPTGPDLGGEFLPTPTLPKGGLAAHGLGERFAVDARMGSASLTIPIATSHGRGASAAEIALTYNSGGRRSAYGWGWNLDVPSVVRRTTLQLPTYTDADTFGLGGSEDLVPMLVWTGAAWELDAQTVPINGSVHRVERFRPRTDDAQTRIERCTELSTGNMFWRTLDRADVTRVFGRSADARIADPDDPDDRVYQWLLEEVIDDRGNVASYEYKTEDLAGVAAEPGEQHRLAAGAGQQANRYLKRIRYGNATPGEGSSNRLLVVLDYGEHDLSPAEVHAWTARPDAFSDYQSGFEVRTWRLCRRVMMFHDLGGDLGPGPMPRLVHTLELMQRSDPSTTLLTAVRHVGYRWNGVAYDTAALPPVELDYSETRAADTVAEVKLTDVGVGARIQLVDFDGEGMPGVLSTTSGGWWYQRPAGEGRFYPPAAVAELPTKGQSDGAAGLRDVDGSSRTAYVSESSVPVGSTLRRPDRTWDEFRSFRERAVRDLSDPRLSRLDLTGDGVADLVSRGPDELVWTAGRGRDGYGPTRRTVHAVDEATGPRPPSEDTGHTWFSADMSGDGLADVVRVRNGTVDYWPNLGWGRYGGRVTMSNLGPFGSDEEFDPRRVRLADLDGTGTADLLYLGDREVTRWTNQSGTSWSAGQLVAPMPPVRQADDLQVLDLLGAGTPCLVWTSSTPGGPTARYLDLAVDGRARQLRAVVNNLGARTEITYDSSARLALAARRAGSPWRTTPPNPVSVVSRVEVTDLVAETRTVTRYRYRDGYHDPTEREFRGFGQVETLDAETLTSGGNTLDLPATRTVEWYLTGRPDDSAFGTYDRDPQATPLATHDVVGVSGGREFRQAFRALAGQVQRSELYVDEGGSGAPVTVTEARLRVRQLQPSRDDRPGVFRVEPLETVSSHYERTLDDPRVTHAVTIDVDDHGTPSSTVTVAYPRRVPLIDEQNQLLVAWSRTELTSVDQPAAHRVSVPTATWEYDITGLTPPAGVFSVADLAAALPTLTPRDYAEAATPGLPQRRLIAATRTEYWDDGLAAALPLGQIGTRALPRRQLKFALTPQIVAEVFGAEVTPATLIGEAGYELADGLWWGTDGTRVYEPAAFYQPSAHITPFGNTATVAYDSHQLMVTQIHASTTAPLSLNMTQIDNDYVTLAPRQLTDAHGTQNRVAFDALGRVTMAWQIAPDGSGDTAALPSTVHTYGADAWFAGTGPAWSHTAQRERHADAGSPWQEQRLYIDGLGRIAMTKSKAEPGEAWSGDGAGGVVLVDTTPAPRWIGTGRTVFNNKGLPVEQYEPYFAVDDAFDDADALVKRTVNQVRRYDPLGRLVRVDYPDGTLETVEIGPWHQTNADRNDTVLASDWYAQRQGAVPADEARAATLTAAHAGTTTVNLTDALGRVVRTRADNGPEGVYETRFALDLTGTVTAAVDARGVQVCAQLIDAAGRVLRTSSVDAGVQRALSDTAGRQLRHWAATGHRVTSRYDLLRRPTHLLVREPGATTERLEQYTVYGESHPQAASRNLVGQMHRRYDAVGLSRADRYDLGGRLAAGARQLLFTPGPCDWSALDGQPLSALDGLSVGILDPETFAAEATFDALGRSVTQRQPDGTEIAFGYNGGGLLKTVSARLGGAPMSTAFITNIGYDAQRRRTGIAYDNGVSTNHAFDPASARLVGLSTRRGNVVLQDQGYTYDPVGNVVQADDHAAQTVFFAGAVVAPQSLYTYDPLYQLRTATGREHASLSNQPDAAEPTIPSLPHPNDANALRTYTETYTYDEVGNITAFAHASPSSSWNRRYQYVPSTNRLAAHQLPGDPAAGPYTATFVHDTGGNVIAMPGLTSLGWDSAGKLRTADLGGGGTVSFHHDAGGNRARKIWQRTGPLREERIYLGEYELFRRFRSGVLVFERRTLHILDGKRRAALVESVALDTDHPGFDASPRIRYQLADRLGSSAIECDDQGAVISYEEYHPFGTTSLWMARGAAAVSTKRYRYTGREKDEETGLYSFGARYYACWLGRWLSPDLAGLADGTNRYCYVGNNPIRLTDETGLIGEEDAQLWLSESRGLWARIRATAKGRGFTQALKQYFREVHELWGGPKDWDIGHKESPFTLLEPGEESSVGIENSAANRSEGATKVKALKAEAEAAGKTVRDAEGHYPGAKRGTRYKQPKPPEVGGIGSKGSKAASVADEATAAASVKPASAPTGTGATAKPPEQLDLFQESSSTEAGGAAKTADVAADTSVASKAAPVAEEATALEKTAPALEEATAASQVAKDASVTTTVAKDVSEVGTLAKDASTSATVSKDVAAAGTVAKDVSTASTVAKDAQTAAKVAKTVAPVAKEVAPIAKEAGVLTKVVGTGAKVVKTVAPALKVIGEVAKPLGVGVAVVDLATANNNSERLVASGDLAAGVAMYCGPVGEAFSLGYTGGGLLDKGIEKASKAAFGVDLSPSNGIAHSMNATDKVVSALIPDDSSKPAYKNENKVAWFLIDKLGF
jgi:RHS repeat-associated protein